MKIFESARTRLTILYAIIISIICLAYSSVLYRTVTIELERGFRAIQQRIGLSAAKVLFEDDLELAKQSVAARLFIVNAVIVGSATIGGYILAGITLRPIQEVFEDQKRFIADASHELRTPITSLMSEIEVNLRQKKIPSSEFKSILISNLEEVQKLKKLTNYLLSLSKSEVSDIKLNLTKISIKKITDNAIKNVSNQSIEKKIKVINKVKDQDVYSNSDALTEILTIFLDNAIKYSGENSKILLFNSISKNNVILSVKDFGIGMNATIIPHIFDRFYRADSSRNKTKIDGHGLGLAIAKSISKNIKADLLVTSKPGIGSVFSVKLQKVL